MCACLSMYITCMELSVSIRRACWTPDTVAIDCCEPHEELLCSANAADAVNSLANAPEPDI